MGINPVGPPPPPEINGPTGPTIPQQLAVPQDSLTSEEQLEINLAVQSLRQGVVLPEPRISINEWVGQLNADKLFLLGILTEIAYENNRNYLIALAEINAAVGDAIANAEQLQQQQQVFLDQANALAPDVNAAATQIDSSRSDYENEIDDFQDALDALNAELAALDTELMTEPTLSATADYNDAVDAYNLARQTFEDEVALGNYSTAVAAYNAAVADYNNALSTFLSSVSGSYSSIASDVNNAIDVYNNAADDFNTAAAALNSDIANYDLLATQYNVFIQGLRDVQLAAGVDGQGYPPFADIIGQVGIAPILSTVPESFGNDSLPTLPPIEPGGFIVPAPLSQLSGAQVTFIPTDPATTIPTVLDTGIQVPFIHIFNSIVLPALLAAIKSSKQYEDFFNVIFSDRLLLLFIFLKRGQPTSQIYEPLTTGQTANVTSNQAGGLSNTILDLSSPRIGALLSEAGLAEVANQLFDQINYTPPAGLVTAFLNVINNTGIQASLQSISNALDVAEESLKQTGPDTFPTNLAVNLGLVDALLQAIDNETLEQDVLSAFGAKSGINTLPENERLDILKTVGNLAEYVILFAAGSDLANSVEQPSVIAGFQGVKFVLGQDPGNPSLSESLTNSQEALGQVGFEELKKQVTDAFADILKSGGIPSPEGQEITIRLAEGLFSAEDPLAFIRESILTSNLSQSIAEELNFAAHLAVVSPNRLPDRNFLAVAKGSPEFQAISDALQAKGLDPNSAAAFVNNEGPFAAAAARLVSQIGGQAALTGIEALTNKNVRDNLIARLQGDVGVTEAQGLADKLLGNLSAIEQLKDEIRSEIRQGGRDEIRGLLDRLDKTLFEERVEPSAYLEKFTEPARTMLRIGAAFYEGTIPDIIPGRTDTGPSEISIAA